MKARDRWKGLKVVVDTNVWISAALSPVGSPARFVDTILEVGLPVFSSSTFTELEDRLWRPKFDRYLSPEQRRRILRDLRAAALWTDLPEGITSQRYSRDPEDDKFIWTALAAEARYLVSGDDDLLSASALRGLMILSPTQALT